MTRFSGWLIMNIAHALVTIFHVLAGAAWMGAMFYSFFVLHPRAHAYFKRPADFEAFIATVSHGSRWQVLAAFAVLAASGSAILLLRWPETLTAWWLGLMGAKLTLFALAFGLFIHVSWRLWPARVFATAEEIPHIQRTFRRHQMVMLAIAALSLALGVLAHH